MSIPIDTNASPGSSIDMAPEAKQVEFDYYPVKDSGYLLHLENVIKLCIGEIGAWNFKVGFDELLIYVERHSYTQIHICI